MFDHYLSVSAIRRVGNTDLVISWFDSIGNGWFGWFGRQHSVTHLDDDHQDPAMIQMLHFVSKCGRGFVFVLQRFFSISASGHNGKE